MRGKASAASAILLDHDIAPTGPSISPAELLAPPAQEYDTQTALNEEVVAYTLALHWAGKLAAFRARQRGIEVRINLAEEKYIDALEQLAKCRLTHVAESKEHSQPHDVAQVKVEEEDDLARVMAQASETSDVDMKDGDDGSEM